MRDYIFLLLGAIFFFVLAIIAKVYGLQDMFYTYLIISNVWVVGIFIKS